MLLVSAGKQMKRQPICWIFALQMRNPVQIADFSVYRLISGCLFHTTKNTPLIEFLNEKYVQQ